MASPLLRARFKDMRRVIAFGLALMTGAPAAALADEVLLRNGGRFVGQVLEQHADAIVLEADGGQITLKPGTAVKLDSFNYSADKPQEDRFLFSLLKGGLRAVTGLVGKRNRDRYLMNTATATVGIRGTTFSVDDCVSERGDADCARLAPAVFVSVSDGEIVVRNDQGELALGAGQFGQIARNEKPLFLSTDPGLQFAPPATFIQSLLSGRQVAGIGEKLECAISAR